MPNEVTIERASCVAVCRSSLTAVDTSPNASRSAAAPAIATVSWRSRSERRSTARSRSSSSAVARPSRRPRATIESWCSCVAVAVRGRDDGVRRLVHRDRLELVVAEHVRLGARAADDALDRLVEVVHADRAPPRAGAEQRRLVDDVLQLGAGEAGAAAGDRRRRRRPRRTGGLRR